MKLRNIAKKNGKEINLQLKKEGRIIAPAQEFEVDDVRAKELLNMKIDNNPIVEIVKETKITKDKEE